MIYQKQALMFHHISKQWDESWKYNAQLSIFGELQDVWKFDETLSQVFYIPSPSKLKQRRKLRNKIVKFNSNPNHCHSYDFGPFFKLDDWQMNLTNCYSKFHKKLEHFPLYYISQVEQTIILCLTTKS